MKSKATRSTNTKGKPNDVDIVIGANLFAVRKSFNMSQETVAAGMNLTFQQIQKYEKGKNRISTSRLCEFSKFFGIPIHVFLPTEFQGIEDKAFHARREYATRLEEVLEQIHKLSKSPGK